MPLLMSPIDGSPMRQISRYGIEIDVCATSGGIWLDKGELEKLMALLREEAVNESVPHHSHAAQHQIKRRRDHDDDYDDDDYDDRYKGYGKKYGKKGKMSQLMDIFDF